MNITFRPRLTKGRHLQTVDEYGPFCLVEAVGFNVDGKVDDAHGSVDTALAALARTLNDRMCAHYSHPIAEAAGMIAPSGEICDACQARLWAVGERIAETGYAVANWSEDQRAALHVRLAVEAAEAVFKLITRNTELWRVVRAALDAASACQLDPTPNNRAAARIAAAAIERAGDNEPSTWAGHAAAHATRAAAALAGDTLDAVDTVTTTAFFANRRAVEAITYALGAVAGDPGRSMGVARRVLNAFGKATSQKATPGVSEVVVTGAMLDAEARIDADIAAFSAGAHFVYPDDAGAAAADAAEPQFAEAAYREAYAEAEHHGCEECAAAELAAAEDAADDQLDAAAADELQAVKDEADHEYAAAEERAAAAKAAARRRQVAAWMDVPVWAITPVELPTEEYQVVDDFDESELGDVADEAIGDAAALDDELQRAEAILTAIAAEHRPVACWTRRRPAGIDVDIEYQTDCCVSCRDANGNPVPSPCRTLVILNSYGEA